MINKEKLTSRYRMIMVKNPGLIEYVNHTLTKLDNLCGRFDGCTKLRGLENTSESPPVDANICCQLETKMCKACNEGIGIDEFCEKHPGEFGCVLTVKIVSLHTDNNQWCACAEQNIIQYAKKHKYIYEIVKQLHKTPTHPKFQKYHEVYNRFDTSLVLLLDCDVAITNMDIRVEDVYKKYKNDIIISRDALWNRGVPINSGVIIFAKSDWTLGIAKRLSVAKRLNSHKYLAGSLVDQPVLTDILVKENTLIERPSKLFEYNKHVTVVDQQVMNSFLRRGHSFFDKDPTHSKWKPGNWMAHVTGMKGTERLKILHELNICETKKQKYKKCAVVGSSYNLLNSTFGTAIDAHNAVFRSNFAPTKGFETDVGTKTTVRICNKVWESTKFKRCSQQEAETIITKLRYYTPKQYKEEYDMFLPFKSEKIIAPSYDFLRQLNEKIYKTSTPKELTSGALSFGMALTMCDGPISVYGFDTVGVHNERRKGKLLDMPYNYYNKGKPQLGFTGTPHKFAMDTEFICSHERGICSYK